jgi:hypothetical protein
VIVIINRSLDNLPNFLIAKLEWLGDRSYSIYLVHMPLLYIAKYSNITVIGTGQSRIFQSITAVVLSIVIGSFSYSKIENRFRRQGASNSLSRKTIVLILFFTFLLPLTTFTVIHKGAESNYWRLAIKYPPLPNALDSLPGCAEDMTLEWKVCRNMNQSATKTVLMIGDSHAGHISLALNSAANLENWNSIFARIRVEDIDYRDNEKFQRFILQNKPDLVIVSQYWQSSSPKAKIENGILNIRNLVPNIYLIQNTPVWPDASRFRLEGYVIAPNKIPKLYPKTEMNTKEKKVSDELAKFSTDNGISSINFESLFCDSNLCTRYGDAGWLYTDSDHLSIAGAALTTPVLRKILKEFLLEKLTENSGKQR